MDTTMHRRIVQLTGARRNYTGQLGQYRAENGQIKLMGTIHDLMRWEHHIEVNFAGFPLGDPRIEETEAAIAAAHRAETGEGNGEGRIQEESQGVTDGQAHVHGDVLQRGADAAQGADDGAGNGSAEAGQAHADAADGNGQPPQLTGMVDGKTRLPEPGTPNPRLVAAVGKLDDATDEHWTREGKPAITAVEKFLGTAGVTRAMIESASTRRRATA